MYLLTRLDVMGNSPVWLVEILPVTLIAFRKMIWVQMEGMLVSGTRTRVRGGGGWRWHIFGGPDILLVLTEMALGRGQGIGEVLADQVGA